MSARFLEMFVYLPHRTVISNAIQEALLEIFVHWSLVIRVRVAKRRIISHSSGYSEKSEVLIPNIAEIKITSLAAVIKAREAIELRLPGAAYWFRGHACSNWELVPSIHRYYSQPQELDMAQKFRLAAPTRYSNVPTSTALADWLSLMQHYGLPTRLLDWTGSILTALYFAVVYDPREGPGAVWVLVPQQLNKCHRWKIDRGGLPINITGRETIFLLGGAQSKELLEGAFSGGVIDSVAAALGSEIDLRMAVQQGAYTVHGTPTPLEQRPEAKDFLMKIVIPEDAKSRLSEELRFLGIRRSMLFPDLANLAKDLADEARLRKDGKPK